MQQKSLFTNLIETFPRGQEQIVQKDFTYKTKKIKFNMHYKHKLITLQKLREFLTSENGCTRGIVCSNFKKCFSCPPFAPSLSQYNSSNFQNCLIYAFWADWDIPINSDNPYFKLINLNRTLSPYAYHYGVKLERILGGKDMIDGRCSLCQKCNVPGPCLHPKERRSSLEAVYLDASRLSEEILDHPIQWYKKVNGKIQEPEYISVVHGLLTDSLQPKEML